MDPNRPQAFGVYDTKTKKTIATFPTSREAMAHCEEIEPGDCWNGYRYTVRPIRTSELSNGQ